MFPLLIKAVKVEGLKAPEKATLIQIADLTNELKGKQAWPSEEYLAVKTGFGRKTVSRAKKSLRDRGILSWLSPKQSSAKNSSCIYTINEKELEKYLPNTAPASIGVGHSDPSDAGSQVTKSVGKSHVDTQVGLESPTGRVIESIYTPTTPVKILLSDTNRIREIKESIGVISLDNWLPKAQECQTYKDPRPTQIFQHRWTNYQILHSFFNQELFRLSGISQSQWSLAVTKYCEQYRILPMGRDLETPNLKAFFPLVQYIAQSDRSEAAWRAVGGIGVDFPKLIEKANV